MRAFACALPLIAACKVGGDDPPEGQAESFVALSDWEQVVSTKFDVNAIGNLTIGGDVVAENFLNRGDVEVYFTESSNIRVLFQRVAVAESQERAEELLGRIQFWAYSQDPPKGTVLPDESKRCGDQWREGCQIRMRFDGQSQAKGTGANYRVYLPRGWQGTLNIRTNDNLYDPDFYPDRGDIKVFQYTGSLNLIGESGVVDVVRDPEAPAVLSCSKQEISDCIANQWDSAMCVCQDFAVAKITMQGSGDVRVNLNDSNILAAASIRNSDSSLGPDSEYRCTAQIHCDDFAACQTGGTVKEWLVPTARMNTLTLTNESVGTVVSVDVQRCTKTPFVTDQSAVGNVELDYRGHIELCGKVSDKCPQVSVP